MVKGFLVSSRLRVGFELPYSELKRFDPQTLASRAYPLTGSHPDAPSEVFDMRAVLDTVSDIDLNCFQSFFLSDRAEQICA